MKKNLILIGICVSVLFVLILKTHGVAIKLIQVGNIILDKIEIADTDKERELGLSGRTSIESDFGLLFKFDKSGMYSFWMKDMNFPIDIIWLDENFKVTGLKAGATPESYPQTFSPTSPSLYVLETTPGLIYSQNLKIGDKLKITIPRLFDFY